MHIKDKKLPQSLILDAVGVTQRAAVACDKWIGKGDNMAADQAAVNAMRGCFAKLHISGRIVIGEGERDDAPMLYIGEELGLGGYEIDIAVDPLEGTSICANAARNSISVLAFANKGGFLHAPDVYMDKIAIGKDLPKDLVDLDNTPKKNLSSLAKAKKCDISDLRVIILDRPRHQELIAKVREIGASIELIGDGDIMAIVSVVSSGADVYMGTGGAPEGVLASAALRCIGGQMQGRLLFKDDSQKDYAKRLGISNFDKKYSHSDMAKGDVIFCATGVTDGLLSGIKRKDSDIFDTHSLVMTNFSNKVFDIKSSISSDML